MILDESIFCSLNDCDSISGLKIFCEDSKKEEIKDFFKKTFSEEWYILLNQVEEKYKNCIEKDNNILQPFSISDFDKGIFVSFDNLLISYDNGDVFAADVSGDIALKRTLEKLEKKYPNISYEGYIGYRYSEPNGGNIVQYTVSSDKKKDENKIYDFIGKLLATYIDDDEFWESFEDELYDYDEDDIMEILDYFLAYSEWLGKKFIDRFLDVVEEIDEDIREVLEDRLNED